VAVEKRGTETVVRIEGEDGKGGKAEREIATDEILVATGRKPNVEGLGLEAAGVRCGPGGVEVDDRLRTSNPAIFACGDVSSPYQFTHVADAQARIVIQNALFFGRSRASALTVPWCTYTSPEVAHVGLTEKTAREAGVEIRTLTIPLSSVDRAILDGADDGLLRLHVEKGKDRIRGATLVAEHAGDMIGELCLAVTHKIGLKKIAGTIRPYPTQGEVLKKAADAWRKGALTPAVKKIFGWWFRLFR
jgi:pyruvate/2-oxoglutarate dehydrogenase complex dihydrolipoamide dehydrogenase (E3) component